MVWNDPVVGASALALLAAVLGGAALHKLLDLRAFRETVRSYRLLPDRFGGLVVPMAIGVVAAEIAIVALLLVPRARAAGAAGAAGLLILYAAAIGINLARGRNEIDCGCSWGGSGQAISGWLVVRNAALLPIAFVAGGPWIARALGAADVLVIAAAGTGLLVFYHAADRLIANWSGLRALGRAA